MNTLLKSSAKTLWLSACVVSLCACAGGQQAAVGASDAPNKPNVESNTMPPKDEDQYRQNQTATRYVLNDKVYYSFTAPCCDQLNPLYDEQANYVCAPSGGFTGRGDEKCPPALMEALKNTEGVVVKNPFYKP